MATTKAQENTDTMELKLSIPKGASAHAVNKVMESTKKLLAKEAGRIDSMEKAREDYQANCHRRWKCIVRSLRKGERSFDLTVADAQDRPHTVSGMCGVVLEDGLTQFAINCLKGAYDMSVEERIVDISKDGIHSTVDPVKVPCYSVEVMEEIENPKKIGKVGHRTK